MNTSSLTPILPTLFSELVYGSPDLTVGTYMLNRGDGGLLASLDTLSATGASSSVNGGASIAAHVDHLRYGLELLNRWARGEDTPWKNADWTASWHKQTYTDDEWDELRRAFRREADAWCETLATPREAEEKEVRWIAGSVAHLAYHLGAIRQIDRATRGPTAEEERALEQ